MPARIVCRSGAECAQLADAARASVETMILVTVVLAVALVVAHEIVRYRQPND
jgi:hypothetical protein